MGTYSRRAALTAIASGAGILAFQSSAYSTAETDRVSEVNTASDKTALVGLEGDVITTDGETPTEPQSFTIVNNTSVTFDDPGLIRVESANGRLEFRFSSEGIGQATLDTADFADVLPFEPGDNIGIEVLTAARQTGTVTDTVVFTLQSSTDGLTAEVTREISLQFDASGQLVYGVGDNILVYGGQNKTVLSPPEEGTINSIGSIVADITGDENADIAYVSGDALEFTQVNPSSDFPVSVDPEDFDQSTPNKNKTRVAAGDLENWAVTPGNNEDGGESGEEEEEDEEEEDGDQGNSGQGNNGQGNSGQGNNGQGNSTNTGSQQANSQLGDAVALYADSGANSIYAAESNTAGDSQTVRKLVDTSNAGGAGGVVGIADIDADGSDELVYVNSSQQLNFIKQVDTNQFSKPSDWEGGDTQSNYVKILSKYKNNGNFVNTIGGIVYGKAKLGNASVGSNNNIGVSAPGNFTTSEIKQIPFVDGSNNLAFINHKNSKTTVTQSGPAKKAALAPVDIDNDGITELFFIGKSGDPALPDVDTSPSGVSNGDGVIFYLSNPDSAINGATPQFELLQVPSAEFRKPGVIGSGETPGFIVPNESLGLNAGTVI